MKIYVLIPLYSCKVAKIKERDYSIKRSTLTPDYSRRFGVENEYYIDVTAKKYEISGGRNSKYNGSGWWYYSAFDPCSVIKKKITK